MLESRVDEPSLERTTFTVIVTGSRAWTDREVIKVALRRADMMNIAAYERVLVHGGAVGADRLAGEVAINDGWRVLVYEADWSVGKAGGVLRNQRMVDGHPDAVVCLAFTADLPGKKSSGTWDMVGRCLVAGIPVRVYPK